MPERTSHMHTFAGIPVVIPNKTDDVDTGSEHWYVSYNNRDIKDYGCDTTALVLGQMEYFLILNGDHRAGLQAACMQELDLRTLKAGQITRLGRCLRYVREHRDQLNEKSDPLI